MLRRHHHNLAVEFGKSTFRFRLVPDDEGYFYCQLCWDSFSQAQWQRKEHAQQGPQATPEPTPTETPPMKRPPWRQPVPVKKSRESAELTPEQMSDLLLNVEAVTV